MSNVPKALLTLQISLAQTQASEMALRAGPVEKNGKPLSEAAVQARDIDNARQAVQSLDKLEYTECHRLLNSLDASIGKLVSDFEPLGLSIARQYLSSTKAAPKSLYTEARIGLYRAAKRWNPDSKIPFRVYAKWWVRTQLKRAVSTAEPSDEPLPDNVLEITIR